MEIFANDEMLNIDQVLVDIDGGLQPISGTLLLKICHYLEKFTYKSILSQNKGDLLTPFSQEKSFENIRLLLNGEESICRFCFARAADTNSKALKYISYDTKEHFNQLTSESLCTAPKLGDRICETCIRFIKEAVTIKNAVLHAEKLLLKFAEYFPSLPPEYIEGVVDNNLKDVEESCGDMDVENLIGYDAQLESDEHQEEEEHVDSVNNQIAVKVVLDSSFDFNEKSLHTSPDVHKNFLCTKCSQRFRTKQALVSHQKMCNSPRKSKRRKTYKSQSITRPYSCTICSKTFPIKIQLEEHEQKHVNDGINICLDCGASFARKEGLKVHSQTIHLKEFNYFCQFCNRGFISLAAKRQHENIHTNNQKFYCNLCSKSFNRVNTLNVHIDSVHKNKRYRCKWCLEVGTIKEIRKFSTFIQHVRKFHEHEYDSDENLNEQIVIEQTIN